MKCALSHSGLTKKLTTWLCSTRAAVLKLLSALCNRHSPLTGGLAFYVLYTFFMTVLNLRTATTYFDNEDITFRDWDIASEDLDRFVGQVEAFDRIHESSTVIDMYI